MEVRELDDTRAPDTRVHAQLRTPSVWDYTSEWVPVCQVNLPYRWKLTVYDC